VGRTRARYPREFKAEAIALVRRVTAGSPGAGGPGEAGPLARVARDLGVSVETLRAWVKQDDVDGGRRDGLTTEEREELRRLRRENRLLKMERDVLKNVRARRHLLLNAETPVGYCRAAREEWPSAYWCIRAREKTWSGGGCGLASGDAGPAMPFW
jgi:transposase